ncbi:MAG TPA: sigma-70 family RNA polymerase sigma factor [Dongiaceae bacterium]|nr:sigma-70 family RNA polymerase sigma factor [Dongiaceae bacterium]
MAEDDGQLVQDYASRGSERAFGELVARHIDLVYSVALRLVRGDVHLAQDVAQTVFADLSLKAKSLAGGAMLAGWLCRHTFFVASAKVRTEQRRRQRERQAVQMNTIHESTEPDWEQLTPILDEVLQELGSQDRDAIVLRYFKRQSLESVGAALGINPDAAQKRVSRALERMRSNFLRRGVTLTSAALAVAIADHAVAAAPAGLATAVSATVAAGAGAAGGGVVAWAEFLGWLKTKTGLACAAVVLLAGVSALQLARTSPQRPSALGRDDTERSRVGAAAVIDGQGRRPGFHWSQVESSDYRQYIANLRAIGCPEQTIRDLIVADLNQAYALKAQAIWKPPARVYWKKPRDTRPGPEQLSALAALRREETATIKELLGISIFTQDYVDLAAFQLTASSSEFLFLPPEKREAARQVLAENGYEEKLAQRGNPYADRQGELLSEKLRLLAQVLTPAELDEYRLLNSARAEWLRNETPYFDCTPQEFKGLLDLREEQLAGQPDHLAVDRQTAIENVRRLLGAERAREFERVSDHGYLNGRRAAERAGLEGSLADRAGQIVYDARLAVEQVVNDDRLSLEERRSQAQNLRAQAEARLNEVFGGEASTAIRQALRFTLANAAQPHPRP